MQRAVPPLAAEVLDGGVACLADPQAEQAEHRDQRRVVWGGCPGGRDLGTELHPVQPEDLGLLRDVGRRTYSPGNGPDGRR
jgi:hypothetical protein